MSHKDPIARRAYHRGWQARQKTTRRAKGHCVDCGWRKRRKGVGKTGYRFSRCRHCYESHCRANDAYQRRLRRRRLCVRCRKPTHRGKKAYWCADCCRRFIERQHETNVRRAA